MTPWRHRWTALAMALAFAAGCAADGPSRGAAEALGCGSARGRVRGLQMALEGRRMDLLPQAIAMLDDPHPVVRSAAVHTVRGLTGWEFDYRAWDPEGVRREVAYTLTQRLESTHADHRP